MVAVCVLLAEVVNEALVVAVRVVIEIVRDELLVAETEDVAVPEVEVLEVELGL